MLARNWRNTSHSIFADLRPKPGIYQVCTYKLPHSDGGRVQKFRAESLNSKLSALRQPIKSAQYLLHAIFSSKKTLRITKR